MCLKRLETPFGSQEKQSKLRKCFKNEIYHSGNAESVSGVLPNFIFVSKKKLKMWEKMLPYAIFSPGKHQTCSRNLKMSFIPPENDKQCAGNPSKRLETQKKMCSKSTQMQFIPPKNAKSVSEIIPNVIYIFGNTKNVAKIPQSCHLSLRKTIKCL